MVLRVGGDISDLSVRVIGRRRRSLFGWPRGGNNQRNDAPLWPYASYRLISSAKTLLRTGSVIKRFMAVAMVPLLLPPPVCILIKPCWISSMLPVFQDRGHTPT